MVRKAMGARLGKLRSTSCKTLLSLASAESARGRKTLLGDGDERHESRSL